MGTVNFRFEVAGVVEFNRRLESGRLAVSDFRQVSAQIVSVLEADTLRNFATEGASGGKLFAPLSLKYSQWKARANARNPAKYPGTTILVLTGRLLNSLTIPGGNRDTVLQVTPSSLIWGSRVPHGGYQAKQGRAAIQLSRAGVRGILNAFRTAFVDATKAGPSSLTVAGAGRLKAGV